jgi:hypothetical protein
MIRSIAIPEPAAGRMGCTPGGSCCSKCASHGSARMAGTNAIARGRNTSLHRALGDVTCDSAGNCYDVTMSVTYGDELMTGPNVNLNDPALQMDSSSHTAGTTGTAAASGIKPVWLYLGGALLFVALLEATSRRK